MQITIVNRKKYNAGDFNARVEYDETDFPIDLDELYSDLEISEDPDDFGIVYDEVAITDFDLDCADLDDLHIDTSCTSLSDLESFLDSLSELIDKINGFYSIDFDTFNAAVDSGYISMTLEDFLDFDSDDYYLHSEINDAEDLGHYVYDSGWTTGEDLTYYLDFDEIGRDFASNFDLYEYLEDRYYPDDIYDSEVAARICEDFDVEDIDDIEVLDIYGCDSYSDLGESLCSEGYYESSYLRDYINFEALGEAWSDSGSFTDYGWLERL